MTGFTSNKLLRLIQVSDEVGFRSGSGQVWVRFRSGLGRVQVGFRSGSGRVQVWVEYYYEER